MSVAQRLDGRLDNEIRRAEIRLADAEIDDVAALSGELRSARKHGKCVLFTDAIETSNRLQHGRQLNSIILQRQTPDVGMLHCKRRCECAGAMRRGGFAAA